MKFAAFDLEIAKSIPDEATDLKRYTPLGISCAAVTHSDADEPLLWQGVPQLSLDACQGVVRKLQELVASGYTLVTWNGCGFDFYVLAQETELYRECGDLALNHVDLMVMVTFSKGHYLALDSALKGAGLTGKASTVTLSDERILTDMQGAKAPALWVAGEYAAVIHYLRADTTQLLELTRAVLRTRAIRWSSRSGKPQAVNVARLLTVRECFAIPEPNVSWMSAPPRRRDFVSWIPG